jgi:PAS domain S-box-containing protein
LKTGSLLRVTGVCSVAIDGNNNPDSFRIWLRSPNDIAVLEQPHWWTLRHTVITLGVVLLVAAAALAWIVILRRQVAAKTGSLRHTLIQVENLKNRYQELFDNANDVIYTTDLSGKLTSLNRMGEIVTGYGRDEALGVEIAGVAAPEHVDTMREMFEKNISENVRTPYELEIVRRDGKKLSLEISSRVLIENGKPAGVAGIARDMGTA